MSNKSKQPEAPLPMTPERIKARKEAVLSALRSGDLDDAQVMELTDELNFLENGEL